MQWKKNETFSVLASKGSSGSITGTRTPYDLLTTPPFTYHLLALPMHIAVGVTVADGPPPLTNSTRLEIYDFVKANPGVQFRGICNELGFSVGLAQFHLGVLEKAGLISFIRDGRYKRYFESKKFSQEEMRMISLLRHETARSILKTMLDKNEISHGELASQLSITSQGLTWQMNRLKEAGVIQANKEGMKVMYSLEAAYTPALTEIMNLVEESC
jgi:predicted transcriptional regulator